MKVLLTLLIGAFSTFWSKPPTTLERVQHSGELRVLTRNNLTTYYSGPQGPRGLEYDLVKRFADALGVRLRLMVAPNAVQAVDSLRHGGANLVAAGIAVTPRRARSVRFGPPYQEVREQVVYRMGDPAPRTPADLPGRQLAVLAGSSHAHTLQLMKARYPDLRWREDLDSSSEEQLAQVWERDVDCTVADSTEVALFQRVYPELRPAFDLGPPRPVAWAFPRGTDHSLYLSAARFLQRLRVSGELRRILDRYYGHAGDFDYVDTRVMLRHVAGRLPRYEAEFKRAARKARMDWRLLAAMGYQESHWNPQAESPTGVRGIMMLTEDTSHQLGITDPADPRQSIDGGARYFERVKAKIPERIPEPDRTWLALAAYNIGFFHLEDARILTQRSGRDPDRWIDVRHYLALLNRKQWYAQTKHGAARGDEAVRFVENVRNYYDTLMWAGRARNGAPASGTSTGDDSIQVILY